MRSYEAINQTEPSASGAEQTTQEQLLGRAPAPITEILGADRVVRLESYQEAIQWLDELVEQESPFSGKGESEIDLSFLDQQQIARVESLTSMGTGLRSNELDALQPHRKKLYKLAKDNFEAVVEKADKANGELREFDETTAADLDTYQPPSQSPSLEQIRDYVVELQEIADPLPSRATLKTLHNLFEVEDSFNERKIRNYRQWLSSTRTGSRALARHGSRITRPKLLKKRRALGREIDLTKALARYTGAVCKAGDTYYELLCRTMRSEQLMYIEDILVEAEESKKVIGSFGEESGDKKAQIFEAEDYLAKKVAAAESVLRKIDPGLIADSKIRKLFERAGYKSHSAAELAKIAEQEQERARPFNLQITEARDIIRGGTRLHVKRFPPIQATAQALHSLTSSKNKSERLLEAEESGFILSVIAGRFEAFKNTLERVKIADSDDEILAFVERSRADVIKVLRDYDLQATITKVGDVMADSHQRQDIRNILTPEELSKLEAVLAQFLEVELAPQAASHDTQ